MYNYLILCDTTIPAVIIRVVSVASGSTLKSCWCKTLASLKDFSSPAS